MAVRGGRIAAVGRSRDELDSFIGPGTAVIDDPELVLDYHAAHPELVRLLLWEGLSGGPVADEANRTAHYQHKAQAYAAAQHASIPDEDLDPDHLVFLIIALAAWWISAPQLARMLTGADDSDTAEHARRRASVVRAAERLARPQP